MMTTHTRTLAVAAVGAALALTVAGIAPGADAHGSRHHQRLTTVADGLDGPRGVDALGHGRTLVTQTDGTFSLVVEHRHRAATVVDLGNVTSTFAPAIAAGRHHTVWILTGGDDTSTSADDATAARLFKWRPGWTDPVEVADIGAYQQTDPDPFNQADDPGESNPFGVAALRDGSVLVSDAAANDLLHVWPNGHIVTVARLKPRVVTTPEGLPGAGTPFTSEAVATSVTVGKDGSWYVGELRGYPATAGTSEIWKIRPGTKDATCDPDKPWRGRCKRYVDGLTSIVDLGAGPKGIYAVTLSKQTWLAIESDPPPAGAEIGGLFLVKHRHSHGPRIVELVRNKLTLPGGVDVAGHTPYVVGPVFGPGSLMKIS